MSIFSRSKRFLIFWLIISLLYCCTVITIELSSIPIVNFRVFCDTALQWGLISVCTSAILLVICLSRIVFAIVWPLLLTFSSIICYYVITLGQTLTPVSIEIAMVNDKEMWLSVISPMLVVVATIALAIGIASAIYRWKYITLPRRDACIFLAIGVVIAAVPFAFKRLRMPVGSRLPYSIYYATRDYRYNQIALASYRDTYNNTPSAADPEAPDLFFILGESLRADHIPHNGYARNTMPHLSADSNVISYPKIYTEYTYTYASVPHILTNFTKENPDTAFNSQSFITLFKKAGYRSAWFANQDISQSYSYFAHECDTIYYGHAAKSLYSYDKWLDLDMLGDLKKWLGKDNGTPHIAMIHTIGSHWWYKSHYQPEHALFQPDIDSKEFNALDAEQIINAYDNTIVATDAFLWQLIKLISDRNAVIIFISDHGESLGENGEYLHGNENEPLHYPACFFWMSPKYIATFPEKVRAVSRNRTRSLSTDVFFHTALDLGGIQTPACDPRRSLAR